MLKRILNKLFPPRVWSAPYFAGGWKCCERCDWPTLMEQHRLDDEAIKRWYCPNCGKIQNEFRYTSSK